MKHLFSVIIAAVGLTCFQACGNQSNNNQDSVDSAKDMNNDKDTSGGMSSDSNSTTMSTTPVDKDDADFAVEAANGSMMEVALAKMANDKATDPRIKSFAAMMITDHTKASENLQRIASAKNITLPATLGDDAKKDSSDLSKKSGADFNKAYMNKMLDDHKKDVKKFEKAVTDCKDSDLKGFASTTLPVIQMHLDSAKAITNKK
jgi:putative membrane protein